MKKDKQKTIKQHEDKYYHIPKINSIKLRNLFLTFIFVILAYFNFSLIDKEVISNVFDCNSINLEICKSLTSYDLINIYPMIGEYILIILTIICFFGIFKELKSYKEEGLIVGIIVGIIAGLIAGLIGGLIVGLIGGLIVGIIWGLIGGLIGGLIAGLIWEFKND